MKESINILCATDNNYAPYCGIMLTSLFESNKGSRFDVYVFADGDISKTNVKKFDKLGGEYGNAIHLVPIDNEMLKGCPINKLNNLGTHLYVTLPTYYRLLAADLLPESVHKVIYLDCDIVINGDLKPMWQVDLTGLAIAGVRDCSYDKDNYKILNYPETLGYINAGVAMYNLDYWRKEGLSTKLFDYAVKHASALRFMDQDVVNGVLYDKKVLLEERWNFQNVFFSKGYWGSYSDELRECLLKECQQAVVIHYCGLLKPWDYRYYGGPFLVMWENYRKISLWKHCRKYKPFGKFLKRSAKMCLFPKKWDAARGTMWAVIPGNAAYFN